MTSFIDLLENPETKRDVENIESLQSSLRAYGEAGEPKLQELLDRAIADLEAATGYRWVR